MPCIQPAVVHRPDYRNAAPSQVIEQNRIIQKIPMNVVNMHHIRLNFLHPFHKLPRSPFRCQPVTVEQTGFHSMPERTPLVAHRHNLRLTLPDAVASLAVSHIRLPAMPGSQFPNFLHDAACRCILPQHRIYL